MPRERTSIIDQINTILQADPHKWTTPEEAQTALLTAQRLMQKYHITQAELQTRNEGEDVKFYEVGGGIVAKPWRLHLAAVIAGNFRCKMIEAKEQTISPFLRRKVEKSYIFFVGFHEDAMVAIRAYAYALNSADSSLLRYLLDNQSKLGTAQAEREKAGADWSDGFVLGVRKKFEEQAARKNSSTALMVIVPDQVAEAAAKHTHAQRDVPNTVRPDQMNDHLVNGYWAGKRVGDGNEELAPANAEVTP